MLHPPTPTLFPYTTLFRSETDQLVDGLALHPEGGEERRDLHGGGGPRHQRLHRGGGFEPREVTPLHQRSDRFQDRKSTRLNSSHLGISYAVFCLKKKKKKH